MRKISLVGQKFGRLRVLEDAGVNNGRTYSKCLCDCGNIVVVQNKKLRSGNTKSCGCYKKDLISALGKRTGSKNIKKAHEVAWENNKKHKMSNSRLYRIWHGMKQRCYNANSNNYNYYGGKGIKVCDDWFNDFNNFMNWALSAGYNDNLTIDRVDVFKDYCPENCRWITKEENSGRVTRGYRYWCLDVKNGRYLEFDNLSRFCRENLNIQTSEAHIRDVLRGKVCQSNDIIFGRE